MDRLLGVKGCKQAAGGGRLKRAPPLIVIDECGWHAKMCHHPNATSLAQIHLTKPGFADRDRVLQHSLEHGL